MVRVVLAVLGVLRVLVHLERLHLHHQSLYQPVCEREREGGKLEFVDVITHKEATPVPNFHTNHTD